MHVVRIRRVSARSPGRSGCRQVQILIVFCYFGIWAVFTTFVVTDATQIIADAVAQETNLESAMLGCVMQLLGALQEIFKVLQQL